MKILLLLLLVGCAHVEPVPEPKDEQTEKLHRTLEEFFKPRD